MDVMGTGSAILGKLQPLTLNHVRTVPPPGNAPPRDQWYRRIDAILRNTMIRRMLGTPLGFAIFERCVSGVAEGGNADWIYLWGGAVRGS